MTSEEFKEIQSSLPNSPGIYKYLDDEGKYLYVGKAKNLRKRVSSYFINRRHESARIKLLAKKVAKIDVTVVETEHDALFLENSLIKKFQPRYNIQLKDDKSYPFICIKKERFPRIFLTRNMIEDGSEYLGPYASVSVVRILLQLCNGLFPFRNCNLNLSEENIAANKFKVCLEYHIGTCLGPCEGFQSEKDYNESVAQIRNILRGQIGPVMGYLKEKMKTHADDFDFERANDIKLKIEKLQNYQARTTIVNPSINDVDIFAIIDVEQAAFVNYLKVVNGSITQTKTIELKRRLDESLEELLTFAIIELRNQFNSTSKELILPFDIEIPEGMNWKVTVPQRGDRKHLLQLAHKNAHYHKNQRLDRIAKTKLKATKHRILETLKEDFRLKEIPTQIECFDNSNFQGDSPVASMVVFKNGKPSKKDYRHYNIKTVEGPDDFASMREVVYRRYRRLKEEEEPFPQLIIIDGGKGQLSAAVEALKQLGIEGQIAIASIAKKLEEIYFPNDPLPLHIDKKSESLKLIQQLRNEAHRFAISFHRKKRDNKTMQLKINQIEGIGPKSVDELLKTFRSEKKIKQASIEELASVIGLSKAKKVYQYYH